MGQEELKLDFKLNPVLEEIISLGNDKNYAIALVKHLMGTGKLGAMPLSDINISRAYEPSTYADAPDGGEELREYLDRILDKDFVIHTEKKYWNPKYLYTMLFIANIIGEGELYIHIIEVHRYLARKRDITSTVLNTLYAVAVPLLVFAPIIIFSIIYGKSRSDSGGGGGE
jgi:hypothetical protein